MKISFRQGIVRYQTDINGQATFLQKSTLDSRYVDIVVSPDPTIVAFAHKNANYIFEEPKTVVKAWGPFVNSATYYLYWDINVLTAELTRGITLYPPSIGGVAPSNPAGDQHWFDTQNFTMKVWNGAKWIEKIRCFAATYSSSAIIKPYALGSQIGVRQNIDVGNIVLDGFSKPLRQSDGSFLTSTTNMSVVGIATKKIKVESEILSLLAKENIAQFNCVQVRPGRTCILAKSTDRMSRVSGIALEQMYEGETADIVSQGLIRSDSWTWPADKVNRPLFCGPNGELTTQPPLSGVLQQVGSVYDHDAIYVNIFPSITLDHPDSVLTVPAPPPPGVPVPTIGALPLVLNGVAPFQVNFVNTTSLTYAPFIQVQWDFTNDGTVDSTLNNASYIYTTPGLYSVRLKVTNASGSGETVQTNYVNVSAPASQTGFTNLQVRFVVDNVEDNQDIRVKKGATFGVRLRVENTGLLTATNVIRTFQVYDTQGQQTVVVSPPAGATVTRGPNYTRIVFAPIVSMGAGTLVDYPPFVLRAPNVGKAVNMEATVSSPEIDSTPTDNTRSLSIELK